MCQWEKQLEAKDVYPRVFSIHPFFEGIFPLHSVHRIKVSFQLFIFIVGKTHCLFYKIKRPWDYAWFSLLLGFPRGIKGHYSNHLRFPLFPLIDLCGAHLSVTRGVTCFDRGRMADGQQMGVSPCLVARILAQARTVRGCQFVISATDSSPVFGISTKV